MAVDPRRLGSNELPDTVVTTAAANQPGGYAALDANGNLTAPAAAPAGGGMGGVVTQQSRPVVDPSSGTLALDLYNALITLGIIVSPGS